jgi:hypothetical protein
MARAPYLTISLVDRVDQHERSPTRLAAQLIQFLQKSLTVGAQRRCLRYRVKWLDADRQRTCQDEQHRSVL